MCLDLWIFRESEVVFCDQQISTVIMLVTYHDSECQFKPYCSFLILV